MWLAEFFRDKVVAVTGASSGIGRETALAFGAAGARVALMARRRERLEEVRRDIADGGGDALVLPTDVADESSVQASMHALRSHYGRLDVVVNNAGVLIPSPVLDLTPDDLAAMMRVNLFGALTIMQHAVRTMDAQPEGGVVVNIDSLAGRRGMSPLGGYCATKFALVGLTEALRSELRGGRVHVSLVMPGVVDTPMVEKVSGDQGFVDVWPSLLNMPPAWVVQAVFAAARFRLIELAVPPGAATLEKIAALAPGLADTMVEWSTTVTRWLARHTSAKAR